MSEQYQCKAKIYHGPGHQSSTRCHNTKKYHKVHGAYYGSYDLYACWTNQVVFSGYFDEAPQSEDGPAKGKKDRIRKEKGE